MQQDIEADQIDAILEQEFAKQRSAANPDSKTELTDEQLIAYVDAEIANSHGSENSELAKDRERALDYYFNRPRGDEVRGRSKVQSSDVMDVIEWMMPDIIESFTTNENAVQFIPRGEYDVEDAKLESQYINYVFYHDAGGYLVLHNMIKDALLQKNGIVKTVWEERTKYRYLEYEGLTTSELSEVLKGDADNQIEPYEIEEEEILISDFPEAARSEIMSLPDVQQKIQQNESAIKQSVLNAYQQAGFNQYSNTPQSMMFKQQLAQQAQAAFQQAMTELTVTLYNVKIKVLSAQKSSKCIPVPPENFRVNDDHQSVDLTDARFTCHIDNLSKSDLIELGIEKSIVDDLPTMSQDTTGERNARRYNKTNSMLGSTLDPTMRNVEVKDCWLKVDFDGDGIAELRHIMIAGGTVVINEYADENPFSSGSPIIVPHRWVGISMYDRLKQIQDIGTAVWRQLLDNLYRANNNRTIVVENQVNMDDVLSPRPGQAVRARNIEAIKPFPYTPIGVESFQVLSQLGRTRMERSGVGPEMMAEGMVIDNDTAHGVERLMSAKEKLIGMIIKNFAETGVADIFKKLHSVELKHRNRVREVEINNQWKKIDPRNWGYRNCVRVKVGLGAGDKLKSSSIVGKILTNQATLIAGGKNGILVDDKVTYNALLDEARYAGIAHPEQYYVDPTSENAIKAAKAMAEAAAKPQTEDKILMLEGEIEKMNALLKEQKQRTDAVIAESELQRKWFETRQEVAQGWAKLNQEANRPKSEGE